MFYLQRGGDFINGNGFVKIFRDLLFHWVFQDPFALKTWLYILCSASYENKKRLCKGTMISLEPGQLIYGRPQWGEFLKIPDRKLRTIIDLMIQDGMIAIETVGRRYSIMTVMNWKDRQLSKEDYEEIKDTITNFEANETSNETSNHKPNEINSLIDNNVQQNDQLNVQQTSNRRPNTKNTKNLKNTYTAEFDMFYGLYPRPEDKRRTFNNWNTCLKSYTEEQLIAAAKNYKIKKAGVDIQYLKSSANFLGKEKPFEDYIPKNNEDKTNEKVNSGSIEVPEFFLKANGYK